MKHILEPTFVCEHEDYMSIAFCDVSVTPSNTRFVFVKTWHNWWEAVELRNHNLSAVPYTWRMAATWSCLVANELINDFSAQERYCLIADRGNPLDGSGTGDTRTVHSLDHGHFF